MKTDTFHTFSFLHPLFSIFKNVVIVQTWSEVVHPFGESFLYVACVKEKKWRRRKKTKKKRKTLKKRKKKEKELQIIKCIYI